MIQVDRILTNATVITMNAQWQIFSPGAIAITGSDIIAVGPAAQISESYHAASLEDFAGRTIIPGIVNLDHRCGTVGILVVREAGSFW